MPEPIHEVNYVFDDRSIGYSMLGDLLAHVAKRCGVTVDTTTHTRWRETMGLLREFDTFADELSTSTDEAMDVLGSYTLFASHYPSLAPDELEPETHQEMFNHTRTILELGDLIAQETDIGRFIELRKVEAYYTVRVIGAAATQYVRDQDGFKLCLWHFTGLGIGANLVDSIIDARKDYAEGKTKLEPSLELYKQLGIDAIRHSKPHIHTATDAEGLRLRGIMIKNRVHNRIKNGWSPYSNLNLISNLWRRHPHHE